MKAIVHCILQVDPIQLYTIGLDKLAAATKFAKHKQPESSPAAKPHPELQVQSRTAKHAGDQNRDIS